jgi:hypothetical protein
MYKRAIGLLLVAVFLFLLFPQTVPAQETESVLYGYVREELSLDYLSVELTEEEMAQGFLKLIEIDHTESTKTYTGYQVSIFMNHEGNLLQAWSGINDVLFIHTMLAMDDPTQPTPANQELFSDSVGNTQYRSSWLPGNDGFSPSVELTFDGVEWLPKTQTSSSINLLSTSISRNTPWAQFKFDYPTDRPQDYHYGVILRLTLVPDEEGPRTYNYYYGINPETFDLQIPLLTFSEEPTTEEPTTEGPSQSVSLFDHPEYWAIGIGIVAIITVLAVAWKKNWFSRSKTNVGWKIKI